MTSFIIQLALKNLLRDKRRMVTATLGIAFASFLMSVQGGLLYGFTIAASRVVDAIDADIWIAAKGIPSIDFGSPLPERYREVAMAAPGVERAGRVAASWTPYIKSDGSRTIVLLVAVDEAFLGRIPPPRKATQVVGFAAQGLVVDSTDATTLGVSSLGLRSEIGGRRTRVVQVASGFSSFLGTPLAFADFYDAKDYLHLPQDKCTFVLAKLVPGARATATVQWLRNRLPDVDVWTKAEFSTRSRLYWLIQTGAGGALSLAAVLGFLIGLVIVSQTTYAVTMEYVEEFATLKAMGGSPSLVSNVVLTQSLACGVAGASLGLLAANPFVTLAQAVVTWAALPWWMYPLVLSAVAALCSLASRSAARPAIAVEPGRVFRA